MRVLVIPDIHLKPWIFDRASDLMQSDNIDKCVCLMDIADDWNKQDLLDLYSETYDRAIKFAKDFPGTLWCWGNHDISYVWKKFETGYSADAECIVRSKINELIYSLPDSNQIAFIHRIDDVLFLHGGLSEMFVKTNLADMDLYNDVDTIIQWINDLDQSLLWSEISPLWFRPQYYPYPLYQQGKILQVVGHTPVSSICKDDLRNIISCDVFSTHSNGAKMGSEQFLILDTKTWRFEGKA